MKRLLVLVVALSLMAGPALALDGERIDTSDGVEVEQDAENVTATWDGDLVLEAPSGHEFVMVEFTDGIPANGQQDARIDVDWEASHIGNSNSSNSHPLVDEAFIHIRNQTTGQTELWFSPLNDGDSSFDLRSDTGETWYNAESYNRSGGDLSQTKSTRSFDQTIVNGVLGWGNANDRGEKKPISMRLSSLTVNEREQLSPPQVSVDVTSQNVTYGQEMWVNMSVTDTQGIIYEDAQVSTDIEGVVSQTVTRDITAGTTLNQSFSTSDTTQTGLTNVTVGVGPSSASSSLYVLATAGTNSGGLQFALIGSVGGVPLLPVVAIGALFVGGFIVYKRRKNTMNLDP